MSLVINLYGGPGTGKSTTATGVFNLLKKAGVNAEYVQEYVKQWAWEERKPVREDQFYFFGKQARKEYSLFKNCDVIVTDSPVTLCAYYAKHFGTQEQSDLFQNMAKVYYDMVQNQGHEYIHVWLNRVKGFNPKGRFQTEEQAREIDRLMQKMMEDELKLDLLYVNGDDDGERFIVDLVKNKVK